MKLTKEMTEEAKKRVEKAKNFGIFAKLDEKSATESPEEQKKYNDIKKNISNYINNNDLAGCLKYLETL